MRQRTSGEGLSVESRVGQDQTKFVVVKMIHFVPNTGTYTVKGTYYYFTGTQR